MFSIKLKKEKHTSCCCGGNCNAETMEKAEQTKKEGGIKVLGGGCSKCHALKENAEEAVKNLGLDISVELITDFSVIAAYGVMSTPALVVNEKVVAYGKVLKPAEIQTLVLSNI